MFFAYQIHISYAYGKFLVNQSHNTPLHIMLMKTFQRSHEEHSHKKGEQTRGKNQFFVSRTRVTESRDGERTGPISSCII